MIDQAIAAGNRISANTYKARMLPLRQQVQLKNRWLKERLDTLLPEFMCREGFDMWIVVAKEWNEDPAIMTLLPEPLLTATAILVFSLNPDGSVDRFTISHRPQGEFYKSVWYLDQEDEYECLAKLVKERDPKVIGLDISKEYAHSAGLSYANYTQVAGALGDELMGRTKNAERLVVGWLERRTPAELAVYPGIVELGHAIIAEAFSSRVIHPGITTTEDVVWWIREKMQELHVRCWFQPTIDIQANDEPFEDWDSMFFHHGERKEPRTVILPGDLLHCDVGLEYLGLNTDQQENAYVLRLGETDAPAGLKAALATGNRLQDIHAAAMVAGRTGNEILEVARTQAKAEGINAIIYTHPIGVHGHGAGPSIGSWPKRGGPVPGHGDYPLFDDTCYSIEFMVTDTVPEWGGQQVRIALEEDAVFTGGELRWLAGRQTHLHLIG
jgi:hypothetical protein